MSKPEAEFPEPQFITGNRGTRTGVILSVAQYEEMLARLEDAADARAFNQAVQENTGFDSLEDLRFLR